MDIIAMIVEIECRQLAKDSHPAKCLMRQEDTSSMPPAGEIRWFG